MRMIIRQAVTAALFVSAAVWGTAYNANAQSPAKPIQLKAPDQSELGIMQIPARANFPITRKLTLGVGKSQMLQFPMDLRDVMIADPEKVDALVQTSDRVFLIAKKAGSTNAFFFDAQGQQIMTLEISIGSDLTGLDSLLRRLLPNSNIVTELAGSAVVLTGSVRTPNDASRAVDLATQFAAANQNLIGGSTTTIQQVGGTTGPWVSQTQGSAQRTYDASQREKRVINLLTIEGEDQVMLKITVAEVQRSVLKQLGVNISNLITVGKLSSVVSTANAFSSGALPPTGVTAGNAAAAGCGVVLPSIGNGLVNNSGADALYQAGPGNCIAGVMKALESQGLVRTLAEPTLTAVSGESAKFLAGGEYPVPILGDNGSTTVSFKEFGVAVAFQPVVLSEGRISLKIDTEVSELSNNGAVSVGQLVVSSLTKRQARSTIELPSGGSIAMAGLISEATRQSIQGLPIMKDLPILGTLFRSRDYQKSETELVIIVTPYLVRPTSRQKLARPDDGLAAASDLKANFLGQINRVYGKTRDLPTNGGLKGDHGFIVE